ncbi:hypothetical protein [Burkholderia ambifaria]|uniref:hypothetical protein n=1 Tax=Burkholderia ambifaria TaxID=152480 RepID=UPI001FC8C906|nr:hypothetical protein [Burkholderia ambifaria]
MKVFAQAPEPDADGRLALSELLGHAGDAARVVQQIEKLEQLQIGKIGRNHRIIVHRNNVIVVIALSA